MFFLIIAITQIYISHVYYVVFSKKNLMIDETCLFFFRVNNVYGKLN